MMNGDLILSKATEHFKQQLQNNSESVAVPEWETEVYYRPMNGKQRDAILKYINDGHIFEALVESILTRSRDENGKLMFKPVHKRELMTKVDPAVIERIATAMGTLDSMLLEEDEEEVSVKKS
jgi:hypothetical protein